MFVLHNNHNMRAVLPSIEVRNGHTPDMSCSYLANVLVQNWVGGKPSNLGNISIAASRTTGTTCYR